MTVVLLAVLFAGCQKMEPVTCEIKSAVTEGTLLTATAVITEDGGTSYFAEQGFAYSFYDTLSATDVYTTMVPLAYSTDLPAFSWSYRLPMADTVYYIAAYVKNNGGIAFSKPKKVSTSIDQ